MTVTLTQEVAIPVTMCSNDMGKNVNGGKRLGSEVRIGLEVKLEKGLAGNFKAQGLSSYL